MHRTFEGVFEVDGTVRLLEPIKGGRVRRVLVTVLDEIPENTGGDLALLAEGPSQIG